MWPEIRDTPVEVGHVRIWWLYQAGFVVKSPGGTTVAIDPYLSDSVMASYGIPRAVTAPLSAAEAEFDALLATHPHDDHLDPDCVTSFAAHPRTHFVGPPSTVKMARAAGFPAVRTNGLRRGESVEIGDIHIEAVMARHMFDEEPTPDAIGYLITAGSVRIYHSGDTEYDARIVDDTEDRVDISLICMNGTAGNMDADEAALLAWRQRPAVAVPMHFGLWHDRDYGPGATLDPEQFVSVYRRLSPGAPVLIPRIDAAIDFPLSVSSTTVGWPPDRAYRPPDRHA
nr:MBL fold metallo-hydrolase [Nakamurella flavida]